MKVTRKSDNRVVSINDLNPGRMAGVSDTAVDKKPEFDPENHPIPIELIIPVVAIPYKIVAIKTGCDKFALSSIEEKELAIGMKPALDLYLAPLLAKHFPLVTMLAVVIGMTTTKAKHYGVWKKEEIEKARKNKELENGKEDS